VPAGNRDPDDRILGARRPGDPQDKGIAEVISPGPQEPENEAAMARTHARPDTSPE
jgi:hypothetical protein